MNNWSSKKSGLVMSNGLKIIISCNQNRSEKFTSEFYLIFKGLAAVLFMVFYI